MSKKAMNVLPSKVCVRLLALLCLVAPAVVAQQPEQQPAQQSAQAAAKKAPSPPADDWKGTNFVTAKSASVSAKGDPFDPSIHALITPQGKICSNELNAAIYRQDVLHALESKAHFDNCAFDESVAYIEKLVAAGHDRIAEIRADADAAEVPAQLKEAMLSFGQALHAIQDFYAHSNYLELVQKQQPALAREGQIPIVEFWRPAGRDQLSKLRENGLTSGRVWWSFPQQCPATVPTHGMMAKDSPTTDSGRLPSKFRNALTGQALDQHTVAFNLATRSTQEFLRWAGKTHPQIEKHCGATLKHLVQSDRRAND
jgi:hypothetical protein